MQARQAQTEGCSRSSSVRVGDARCAPRVKGYTWCLARRLDSLGEGSVMAQAARAVHNERASYLGLFCGVLLCFSAACRGSSERTGEPITLNLHLFPEPSGAFEQAALHCSAQAQGRYRIAYQRLPNGADDQRQQMVRRLAAKDSALDILGLDVVWTPEFAEAGFIRKWTGQALEAVQRDTLETPLATATFRDTLYAAPLNSNTQLLWYRADLVPVPPRTWAEMLGMAEALAREKKPHYIEVQGAPYEGLTVWFNTLVESAGGSILENDGTRVALGEPARRALEVMSQLAHSPAADPSLDNQMEDQNRLRMEAGLAAFQLNYPFVYPSMRANRAELFRALRWAPYPRVDAGKPARVTIGGNNLAVSAYSRHPELAFEAILCLRGEQAQRVNAVKGGLPPTLASLYEDPEVLKAFPFAPEIKAALQHASLRPLTPAYQNASIVISHTLSGLRGRDVASTLTELHKLLDDAIHSRGLIP